MGSFHLICSVCIFRASCVFERIRNDTLGLLAAIPFHSIWVCHLQLALANILELFSEEITIAAPSPLKWEPGVYIVPEPPPPWGGGFLKKIFDWGRKSREGRWQEGKIGKGNQTWSWGGGKNQRLGNYLHPWWEITRQRAYRGKIKCLNWMIFFCFYFALYYFGSSFETASRHLTLSFKICNRLFVTVLFF